MTMLGLKHSKETIEKMKNNHRGFLGKKHNKEFKEILSKRMKDNKFAEGHSHQAWNKRFKDGKEQGRSYYQRRRDWVDGLKKVPCKDCGLNFPPECMDFDHVRGIKEFEIHKNIMTNIERLLKEMEKCDIICSNCHRIRTRKSDLLRKRSK